MYKYSTNTILYLVIVVLAFLLLRQCNVDSNNLEDIDLTPDTLYLPGTIDTVKFEHIKVIHDTVEVVKVKTEIIETAEGVDTLSVYESTIEDSLLSATITSK